VPYGIAEIDSPLCGAPFAAERLGLAAGGRRYGVLEDPAGLRRDLRFTARGVPPLGYRLYRIEPGGPPSFPALRAAARFIENEFHRVERDPRTGRIVAIADKKTGRALVVPGAEPSFGELLAAPPGGPPERGRTIAVLPPRADGASVSFAARFCVRGHPVVEQTTTLRSGLPRIETAIHLVKDPEPLLSAFVVFPFAVRNGRFLCDTPLAAGDPEADRLPGAFLDRVTVGDWVSVSDGRATVLWSSPDAPVASLGGLRPDRVSPAHACRHAGTAAPAPVLRGGMIVSCVAANNFGTNFAVSQSGTLLFRYAAAFHAGPASPAAASVFGEAARSPLVPVFTRHPGPRTLPPAAAFLRVSDPGVRVLTLKTADDGDGCVVRLWNPEGRPVRVSVSLPRTRIARAVPCSMTEEAAGPGLPVRGDSFAVRVAGRDLATVRLTLAPERNIP